MKPESSNQEERIKAVLHEFENREVSLETISAFAEYLCKNLEMPGEVYYSQDNKYYLLCEIEDSGEELYGILAKLKSVSEGDKETIMPLCDLRAVDNRSRNYLLINDYSTWFINNQ